jgi:type VI secretion system ImpM family protein
MMSPVAGYYGKLPLSPEFLRLHAAGPELRWLDDWLQRGVLYAKSVEGPQWPTLVAQSDLWNFLYIPAGQGRIVCGVLFASQDKAGRSFPFLSFLLLDLDSLSRKPWLVPLVAAEFLEIATGSARVLRTTLDWNDFRRAVDQAEGKVLSVESAAEAFAEYTRAVNASEWWVSLWGSFDDSRKYRLAQGLAEMVRSTNQQAGRETSSGLKFPLLSGTGEKKYDLSFWLAASLPSVSPGHQQELGVVSFWNRSPTKVAPCALISIGPGSPNMTRFLVSPEAQDNSWHNLLSGNQDPAEFAETIKHDGYRMLSDGALSIDKLLEYFCGLGRTQPC